MRSPLLLLALLSAAEWALAQSPSRPDPTDPRAPALVPRYQSAFPDYQPFVEQKNSWKQVNQEVADSPAMGSMQHKPGMTMPGMGPKTGAAKGKGGTAGHDMSTMKDKPGGTMPGMEKPAAGAPKGKEGAGGHDMGTMKEKPGGRMRGTEKPAASAPKGKEDHDTMAMAKPQAAPGHPAKAQAARITGTGIAQQIDKVNGKVKLTHDPIAAMGWPKMTLFFRLKEGSLADQVKEGDKVEFSLEKSSSGYVISGIRKPISESGLDRKPASHSGH